MLKQSIKWGLIASLVGGLASCTLPDFERNDSAQYPITYGKTAPAASSQASAEAKKTKTAAVKSTGIATEPAQKSTPGPKRAAAPQLPVIQ